MGQFRLRHFHTPAHATSLITCVTQSFLKRLLAGRSRQRAGWSVLLPRLAQESTCYVAESSCSVGSVVSLLCLRENKNRMKKDPIQHAAKTSGY